MMVENLFFVFLEKWFFFLNLNLYFYLILFLIVIVEFTALRYQLVTIN